MIELMPKIGTPVARGLNIILFIAMCVLAVTAIGMIIFALIMAVPNSLQEGILARMAADGAAVPTPDVFARSFCFGAIMTASYMYVIYILHAIVKTLLTGDPFVPENISRLRIMWIVLALSEIFRMIIHNMITVPSLSAGNVALEGEAAVLQGNLIDIRLGTWFLVFVIAALAEVFRHGAELRRDQQLTV